MLLQQSPFRGEDEDEIYDAILADEPLYPIHMPRDSVSILQKLLTREPELRLGSGPTDAQEVMSHAFFRNINWDDIYHKRVPPPFLPTISNPTDTSNFDTEFTSVTPVLTPVQSGKILCIPIWLAISNANCPTVLSQAMQEEFRGFSYTADFAWFHRFLRVLQPCCVYCLLRPERNLCSPSKYSLKVLYNHCRLILFFLLCTGHAA